MKDYEKLVVSSFPTGSRFIAFQSARPDSDIDYMVLTTSRRDLVELLTTKYGWLRDWDTEYNESLFTSLKQDYYNLLVTDEAGFYQRFHMATLLAKRFKLESKEDRVALFTGMLYDFIPDFDKLRRYIDCEPLKNTV